MFAYQVTEGRNQGSEQPPQHPLAITQSIQSTQSHPSSQTPARATTCPSEQDLYFFHIVKEQPIFRTGKKPEVSRQLAYGLSLIPVPCPLIPDTGGAGRDRTDDLLLAKQALSQLSYSPDSGCQLTPVNTEPGGSGWIRTIDPRLIKTML